MATKLDAVTSAYLLSTGKPTPPAAGTSKGDKLRALAVKFYRDIQVEPGVEWEWLYDIVEAGTVTATDTFELADEINFISTAGQQDGNYVRVLHSDGNYTSYIACSPQQLYKNRLGNYVAKVADNSIKFSKPFTSIDPQFGGTIQVPAILKLDDLTADNSEVLPQLVQWLPARMAAQYVLNDSQLNYLYDDLLAQANEILTSLKEQNGTGNASYNTGIDYFASYGNVGVSE